MPRRTALLAPLLAVACAGASADGPAAAVMPQGVVAEGARGGLEAGRLASPDGSPANVEGRLTAAGEAIHAADRPMPITRPLEGYVGRQIWLGPPGGPPERWFLRGIGADHLTVERTRTYRVLPVRRIAEITWTDLTGIDPTPRIVLGPE